jgi:acetyl esterase/lipase
MPRRPSRRASPWIAELVTRTGWTPIHLLNRVDRLTPGRDRSKRIASGVPYGASDRQLLDIWAPAGKAVLPAGERKPVVIFFYGGGWNSGHREDYGFAGAAFAGQGFLTVVPDYRLVPNVRFPTFMEDAAEAVRWVHRHIHHYGGDPDRIALSGHSAGAYIGAMLALDPRWLGQDQSIIKAGVLFSGPYDFAPFRESRGRNAFGHWPDPHETQPVNHAHISAPPLMLAHGSSDRVVYAKNSRVLAARLADVGAPVKLQIYPGAGHSDVAAALARPFRRRLPVLADSVAFLRSVLSPPT